MAEVAAQPYPYRFEPRSTALLVIDMQRDFVEPGGFGEALGNDVGRLSAIVPTVRALLDWARRHAITVLHTREGHRPDLADCPPAKQRRGDDGIPGELPDHILRPGADIDAQRRERVVAKDCVAFAFTQNKRGSECLLIEDATESYFPEFKRATLDMVRAQGAIVGWTAPFAALRASL